MEPFGKSLLAYLDGDAGAQLVVDRDDGSRSVIPVALFFRDVPAFSAIETHALALCKGRVLDVGAGAGSLSIELQRRGHRVTALDISTDAANVVMRRGGVDVVCGDVFSYEGGPFDTLLVMGHGIGMVETIDGLKRFLDHAQSLVALGGQVLLDSLDVRATNDPANLAYHQANRDAGRYIGVVRMRFEFAGCHGPWCGWLHVDDETLAGHADDAGWSCSMVHREANGDYLARLTRGTASRSRSSSSSSSR